jgi:Heterokaryon incompatibility protein (HET)/Zinc finger, C2H2 type
MKTHTRPYQCTVVGCISKFASKKDLVRHQNSVHKTIMAEERYSCDVSGCKYSKGGTKSFARKDHLFRHMRTHMTQNGERHVTSDPPTINRAEASFNKDGMPNGIETCPDEQYNPTHGVGRGFSLQISPNLRSKIRFLEIDSHDNFSMTEFLGDNTPHYAILSHTWGADGDEVTFKDLMEGTGSTKIGYKKLRFCGNRAKTDGLRYFWVDSCCIDKSNSVELSAAINSMFRWYQKAAKCYVYLSDISLLKRKAGGGSPEVSWESAFKKCRWFTRGWTLPELIAPRSVEFFSRDGRLLGDKMSLEPQIHDITGIAVQALQGCPLSQFSIDERMSWAAKRETTIEEDRAYSLLGIFGIHMSLIYGEGRENAFRRLRKKINKLLSVNGFDKGNSATSTPYN